jgi:hypothetical protein
VSCLIAAYLHLQDGPHRCTTEAFPHLPRTHRCSVARGQARVQSGTTLFVRSLTCIALQRNAYYDALAAQARESREKESLDMVALARPLGDNEPKVRVPLRFYHGLYQCHPSRRA